MKNKILITITVISAILLLFVACTLDSDFPAQAWQAVIAIISGAWLIMFAAANGERIG